MSGTGVGVGVGVKIVVTVVVTVVVMVMGAADEVVKLASVDVAVFDDPSVLCK